jgi:hypothetical protein
MFKSTAPGWARATPNGRRGLLVRSFTSAPTIAEVREGRRDPPEGWVSPNYGQLERAPVLIYTAMATLPLRIVTLLWPAENVRAASPGVDISTDRDGRPIGLFLEGHGETTLIDDDKVLIERKVPGQHQ